MGGDTLERALRTLLTRCLIEGKTPTTWKKTEAILLFKKSDNTNIENYHLISLLSHVYKHSRILTNRLTEKLDFYLPLEQAGFRKSYTILRSHPD